MDLLKKPVGKRGKVHDITPESAGWGYVGFGLYRLEPGDGAAELTGGREVILVLVEGQARLSAQGADYGLMGERMTVFDRTAPHCLYVPPDSEWRAPACGVFGAVARRTAGAAAGAGGYRADTAREGHQPAVHQQYRHGGARRCRQPAGDRGLYARWPLVVLSAPPTRRG
jgi:5-deoxy-glucuronate isomerase